MNAIKSLIFAIFTILIFSSQTVFASSDDYLILKPTTTQVQQLMQVLDVNGNSELTIDKSGNLVVVPLARYDHGLILGNNTGSEVNPMVEVARSYSGTGNAHGYSDTSQYNAAANGLAYDSYDAVSSSVGTHNLDHIRGFQCKMTQSGTGTIGEVSCFGVFSLTDNAGTTTNVKEFGGVDPTGTATVQNLYGFYMPSLTHGTNNWAIFTNLGKVHFGDTADFSGKVTINNSTSISGLSVAVTGEKTTNYTPSVNDDVIVMNATTGNKQVNLPTAVGATGKIYTIKMVGLSAGNVVQVLPLTGQTINGFSKGYNMTHADQVMVVQSNGTAWNKISQDDTSSSNYYQQRGSSRWMSGVVAAAGTSTSLDVVSTIYAVPFTVPATEQFDREAIEVAVAANPTSNDCRVAIYTDNGNAYPDQLVPNSDSGTNNNIAAMRIYNFSSPITLQAGQYWKTVACNTAATTQPTFRSQSTGLLPVLGYTRAGGVSQEGVMLRANPVTYGPFPQTFPVGATVIAVNTLAPPLIFLEMNKG